MLGALAIAMAVPGIANAGFQVDDPEYRPPVHPGSMDVNHAGVPDDYKLIGSRRVHHVRVIGHGNVQSASGYGDKIALATGLQMLVPDGWVVYSNPSIDPTTSISWNGGEGWVADLRKIGVRHDLHFTVDWSEKMLRVDPMPADPAEAQIQLAQASRQAKLRAEHPHPVAESTAHKAKKMTRGDAFGPASNASKAGAPKVASAKPDGSHANQQTGSHPHEADSGSKVALNKSKASPADVPYSSSPSPYPQSKTMTQQLAQNYYLSSKGLTAEWGQQLPWFYRTMPDGTKIRQLAGRRPPGASMTMTEFYQELIVINAHNEPVKQVIKDISPKGWKIVMATPPGAFQGKIVKRLVAERPRGEVISEMQQKLGVKIAPYPIQHLVVVSDQ